MLFRSIDGFKNAQLSLSAGHDMATIALYAALLAPQIGARCESIELNHVVPSSNEGPDFLNVQRFLDVPQLLAMAAENSRVVLYDDQSSKWTYPLAVSKALGWRDHLQVRPTTDH